jgi:RNA-binding protein
MELTGKQRKHLRGLAHGLKPLIHVGGKGLTPELLHQLDEALEHHELIKVKFLDFKDAKAELTSKITTELDCAEAGTIGHHVILYRPARDPDRREIELPARPAPPPTSE